MNCKICKVKLEINEIYKKVLDGVIIEVCESCSIDLENKSNVKYQETMFPYNWLDD